MKVAVLIYEDAWFVLAATSLIRGLRSKFGEGCSIAFFVNNDTYKMLSFNLDIKVYSGFAFFEEHAFDIVINYTESVEAADFANYLTKERILGFRLDSSRVVAVDESAQKLRNVLHDVEKTDKNILQLLYRVADMKWKGQGYNLNYFPRNKKNKHKTGLAIRNDTLKNFINDNLHLTLTELHPIPSKVEYLKKIDEINRCVNIITDDLFILHAAISLRKNVQFIDTINLGYRIEFFGSGAHHRILNAIWQNNIQ